MTDAWYLRRDFWRRYIFIVPFAVLFLAIILLLSSGTTALWPDHGEAIGKWGFAAGVLLSLVLGVAGFIVKPESRYPWPISVIAMMLMGLICGMLLGMGVADRVFQRVDFSGLNVTRRMENFLIARAFQTHGKGACDRVQISGGYADFCINKTEYKEKFFDKEDVQTGGYCLRADTERNGEAVRIMHSSSRPFRRGAVIVCSAAEQPTIWTPR